MSVTNEIRKLVEEELKNTNKQEELHEFDLGGLAKIAGGAASLLSSENFRRTAMQLFLRMAEKELTQHLRQSADGIAQSIVPCL